MILCLTINWIRLTVIPYLFICKGNYGFEKEQNDALSLIFGISYQLRDKYSICRWCWNVAKYKWKGFFMLIKKPISPSQLAKGQHRIILGKMLGSFSYSIFIYLQRKLWLWKGTKWCIITHIQLEFLTGVSSFRKLPNSSGISYQLRDKYSICRWCWNVAKYKWKGFFYVD
jgi:hypothetical protein